MKVEEVLLGAMLASLRVVPLPTDLQAHQTLLVRLQLPTSFRIALHMEPHSMAMHPSCDLVPKLIKNFCWDTD